MMGKILPEIQETEDYVKALELLKTADEPPTAEQVAQLLDLYERYLPSSPNTARLCVAVDLLFRQGEAHLAAMDLPEADSDALLELRGLMDQSAELTQERTGRIMAAVESAGVDETLRTILARAALDIMAGSWNYQALREQIVELAEFLTERSEETLEQATTILRGVKYLCRKL